MENYCPRLVDYLLLVGAPSPISTANTPQPPVILNRFPPLDHQDFILPPDVAYFCQPEGCFWTTNLAALETSPTSFVFTLTDKESGKIRYGVCYNFFRLITQLDPSRSGCSCSTTPSSHVVSTAIESTTALRCLNLPESPITSPTTSPPQLTHALTSLCLISHYPFFSQFKVIVEFLHTLIQRLHRKSLSDPPTSDTVWGILTGSTPTASSPVVVRRVHEIQSWILRLLNTPSPIPGKTCIYLSIHPKDIMKPLLFAQPEKSRLSLFDFPLHLPIQLLGVARALRILVCLLMEQKVVLQSSDYNKLSICVLALVTLIYPLQYMFPVIPLLPPCMPDAEQLLIAPTPYIIGLPTSFYSARKVFRMPKDVWLANLDTQELSYPEVMDDIPDIPEPECSHLVNHFNRILTEVKLLDSMSVASVGGSSRSRPSKSTRSINVHESSKISGNCCYFWSEITDEASASVATRVATVLFLLSKNVLGGLSDHTRTLRLYPRPVVALQFENFMKSRPRPCLFTSMLAKTQAVEYFAESCIYSQNDAYQRIELGQYSPELIGDKPRWFADLLTPISLYVFPEASPQNGTLSDTDTESVSSSPIFIPSSVSSNHLDCAVVGNASALIPDIQLTTVESSFVRPGVSLPPALAAHFHPPTQLVLSAPSVSQQSSDHGEVIGLVDSVPNVQPDAKKHDSIPLNCNQTRGPHHKRHSESPFPAITVGQTVRTLRRLSLSALAGETPFNTTGDRQPNQMINWNSPLTILLGGVFNIANPGVDSSATSMSVAKSSRNRLDEERYLDHVARSIKQGDTPGIFSRNYLTSLLQLESNRNLLLSRINMTYSDLSAEQMNSYELKDVAITTWNQYKAMVWVLRKIASGLTHSLRSDLVVPTSANHRVDSSNLPSVASTAPSRSSGGLASAFCLLEIAHTHYFPLPSRQLQGAQSVSGPESQQSASGSPTAQSSEMLTDDSSELQSSGDSFSLHSKAVKIFVDDSIFSEPKSARSRGYCYRQSKLFLSPYFCHTVEPQANAARQPSAGVSSIIQTTHESATSISQRGTGPKVGRTYLFEDLLTDYNTQAKLWDNLQFWEDAFLDAVAQERDIRGMDFHPMELLDRYNTATPLKRKHLEMEEDKLLTGLMHNMIAFMVMVDVDRVSVRRKIRRLLAKSHMGLHYSQEITNLLEVLDFLHGNDIDLKPMQGRSIPSRSYDVYRESNTASEPLFIEVCEDFLLLRNLLGGILERWWYDQLINLSYRLHTRILCISVRSNEQSSLHLFYTTKCQVLYQEIRLAMEKVPLKICRESAELKGEIDVIDLDGSCSGTIRLCTDGFSLRFGDREISIPVPCIKRCSTPQQDLFMMEYFDSHEKRLQSLRLQTDFATSLLYHFHILIADFSTRLLTTRTTRSSRASSLTSKHPSTSSMPCVIDEAN